MTPVSLNPPPSPNSLLHGQNQLFNIPIYQESPDFFNLIGGDFKQNHDQGDKKVAFEEGSSSSNNNDEKNVSSSRDKNLSPSLNNGHGCEKWMSSKMRLMKKISSAKATTSTDEKAIINTTSPRSQDLGCSQTSPLGNNTTTTTRVCVDCGTTTTPLWRSGPMGPKSLCNACGIRQRKARRATAEAAKSGVHNKDKKNRVNNFTKFKNKHKSSTPTRAATTTTTTTTATTTATTSSSSQDVRTIESYGLNMNTPSDFEDIFPTEEVANAALLLMKINCDYYRSYK